MSNVFKLIKTKAVKNIAASLCLALITAGPAWSEEIAEEINEDNAEQSTEKSIEKSTEESSSPWLVTPLISSDPKLSTSIGGLASYLYNFDETSPASMFGITGTYSNTDSFFVVGFTQMFFDDDNQRVMAVLGNGTVHNDYDDYLGSGIPLKTTDDVNFKVLQYSYRIYDDWFLGVQGISSNYKLYLAEDLGRSAFDDISATVSNDSLIELAGFTSNALGLLAEYDTRDRQRSPTAGQHLKVNNSAYREALGGDISFDAYFLKYSTYYSHGNGSVLAISSNSRWTDDAPVGSYSSVQTLGYTRGQYLAPHVTDIQFDERFSLSNKWGLVAYAALACLYGETDDGTLSCTDSENIFPSISLGATYSLNKKEGIVVRTEFAKGKGSNRGFYMSFGHPF